MAWLKMTHPREPRLDYVATGRSPTLVASIAFLQDRSCSSLKCHQAWLQPGNFRFYPVFQSTGAELRLSGNPAWRCPCRPRRALALVRRPTRQLSTGDDRRSPRNQSAHAPQRAAYADDSFLLAPVQPPEPSPSSTCHESQAPNLEHNHLTH